ncbi:TetR/AcrR family transcriptional regulator [Nonomuraea fuscirosea]
MSSARANTGSRTEKRKAQTRQKLIGAARAMLADGTVQQASIQDITEAADVGFGSFYNHFTSKSELFEAAVADVLEETGALLDELTGDIDDPAVAFAQSVRLAARLARTRPETAKVLVRHGMTYLGSDRGLAPRALRDITAGIASGRFQASNPRLALAAVGGSLLATLHLMLSDPGVPLQKTCDQLAEHLLRLLGLPADEARELSLRPLPEAGSIG